MRRILEDMGQYVDKQMFTSSIAIGTPLKGEKEIHRPAIGN